MILGVADDEAELPSFQISLSDEFWTAAIDRLIHHIAFLELKQISFRNEKDRRARFHRHRTTTTRLQ